jgi:spermidine synthase
MKGENRLSLCGFNNLAKTLDLNLYTVERTATEDRKKRFISHIDGHYNSSRLREMMEEICRDIDANILDISTYDYEPHGASALILLAEEDTHLHMKTVAHLDKSHISLHTYPEHHDSIGISTFRVDIALSTCGNISPLSVMDKIFDLFSPDIAILDFNVRGYTRDTDGKKIFMDKKVDSLQECFDEETLKRYVSEDFNSPELRSYYTRMIRKDLFELRKEGEDIWREVEEIYSESASGSKKTESWHIEKQSDGADLRIKKETVLYSGRSEFQDIEVFESKTFGRILAIDGYIMLTEKDEFIYHEMMVHVPMSILERPKRALVIGGGDGGSVRELVKHVCLERIDFVEIDGDVIETSKKFFPSVACGLGDPRVRTVIGDGIGFVSETEDIYDLIIIDSTDPYTGPGEGLFTSEFYRDCHRILAEDGILVNQHENPYYQEDAALARKMHLKMRDVFPVCTVYQAFIPTYPSGHWLFGFASKTADPLADAVPGRMTSVETKYYNDEVRRASFALPNYVKKLLE